uniref:Uncharacterized protein n=1 Tax=Ditylenchus dipsaci TaxID=166011 RepID=A0A915CR16_9BILA
MEAGGHPRSKAGSVHSASKKYSIFRSSIRDRIKKEQNLLLSKYLYVFLYNSQKYFRLRNTSTSGKNRKRLRGGGRLLTFADSDRELATWIIGQGAKNLRVSKTCGLRHFRLAAAPAVQVVLLTFTCYYLNLNIHNFSYKSIYATDETAVELDPSGGKCIDERGAREHILKFGLLCNT